MENSKEMIQNFGDMVAATEKMSQPWQDECQRWKDICEKKTKSNALVTILTNLFWAIIVGMLIWFAYMTPMEMEQGQDYQGKTQTQTYAEGVTDGN